MRFRRPNFFALTTVLFMTSPLVFAQTNLTPNADAKKFTSADGKAAIYEISYPVEKSDKPKISSVRIRVEDSKIKAFDLEWSPKPDASKRTDLPVKRKVAENFRRFMEFARETSPSPSLELVTLVSLPGGRFYKVSSAEPLLEKMPANKVSVPQKEELKREWNKYFFGFENGDASLFETKGDPSVVKSSDLLTEIKADTLYGAHNSQALQTFQDHATLIAQAVRAYGTIEKGFAKNKIQFEGFPQNLPVQDFNLPEFIKGGIDEELKSRSSTVATKPPTKNNRNNNKK